MPRYRSSITVPSPVAEAFAFVTDFRNAARWDPRVAAAAKLTEGTVRPGTRFVLASRLLGKELQLPYEVLELEPEGRVVLAGRTRFLGYRDEITVEAASADGAGATRLTYDARLSLRGILAVGNPLLSLVFRRIGDDAVAGIARALAAEEARRRENARGDGAPAMAREITPEAVRRIVAMADRPVLRNLLITQGYHQLSRQLVGFVGGEDANWCTYAAWASKTAGTFIREEELSAELRRLHRALHRVHPEAAPAGGLEGGQDLTLRVRELTILLLTRMAIPGDVLALGEDLPAPLGRPLYPELLDPLADPELVRTLERFGAAALLAGRIPGGAL